MLILDLLGGSDGKEMLPAMQRPRFNPGWGRSWRGMAITPIFLPGELLG